jgi:hypothetical protein
MNKELLRKIVLGDKGAAAVAFSPLSLAPLVWLKADAALFQDSAKTTSAVLDGDPVGNFADKSGNGKDGTQTVSTKRGVLKLNIQNGLPVVRTDGVDDFYNLTGLTAPSGGHTFLLAFNPPSYAGTSLKYAFDTATGRITLAACSNTINQVGWQTDAGWTKPNVAPAATVGFQILTWDLYNDGTGEMFRNGTSLGTGTYVAKAIGGATSLSSSNDGTSSFVGGDFGEFLAYPPLTSAQRDAAISYLRSKWGV